MNLPKTNISDFSSTNNSLESHENFRLALRWGGVAGDGLQSTTLLFGKYLSRLNYFINIFPGTQSTIRGGHVWTHLEFSSRKFYSFDRHVEILVAFNEQTLDVHLKDLKQNGLLPLLLYF